ncbi:MAG: bacterioferritin [Actinomycetota bacterium]|nr:bacterioferritin [Actinomycetota bacterium]
MQGDAAVIELLNEALTAELTAINQYFIHAKLSQDWGYTKLADAMRDESIDEMRHAETIIERIIFLEGMPNLQRLGSIRVGEDVPEQLSLDLALEMEALALYRRGVVLCLEKGDVPSRELFEQLVSDEEHHVDWLETQLSMIEDLGVQLYLQLQAEGGDSGGAEG